MKIASCLDDLRINAKNILVEMTILEYSNIVTDIIEKNEYQRRKIRSSKTVYTLLKEDLLKTCVIPPIVLALTCSIDITEDANKFKADLNSNKEHLLILDGLQRTYTILELLSELRNRKEEQSIARVENTTIRVEIYVGLNRLGILYRMLTLNTGQTPMSLRQQIEMLYLDYLKKPINGIALIRESDVKAASRLNEYNFKDVVEGFNAYLDRDELPIDKADLLENIHSLEKLSKENQSTDLFEKYLIAINGFIIRIVELCGDVELSEEYIKEKGSPFGKNAIQIFKKPQAMSGFGAAIGKLIDFNMISSFESITTMINSISFTNSEDVLEELNNSLLWLKSNSKKIGNAQRSFFTFFFRELFNTEADGYLNLIDASKIALRKYQSQND